MSTAINSADSTSKISFMKFHCILWASIVISALGILWGAIANDPSWGQRGGAIAVVISFFALFVLRDTGSLVETIDKLLKQGHFSDVTKLEVRLDTLAQSISGATEGQAIQNRFLAMSSVLGTLVWGFGDYTSQLLVEWGVSLHLVVDIVSNFSALK